EWSILIHDINERDVIIWDVLVAIISRNILRNCLGWQSFISNKFATIFLAISRISAGVHERLSSIFVFCDRI
ncbi:unnamed protein product, partial [Tenebrio molitor]